MIVIDRNIPWILELAWLGAFLSELGHEREPVIAIVREYLYSMEVAVNNEQETSMMVEHQAKKVYEQVLSIAFLLDADREHDSCIAINRIVSHPLRLNPTRTTATRETRSFKPRDGAHETRTTTREIPTQPSNYTFKQQDERRSQEQHHTQAPNAHTREPLVLDTSC